MGKLSTALKATLAAQFLPRMVWAAADAGGSAAALHYRPLNGDNLRELARRKMHHGSDIFLNPMGIPRDKRFWQVLSWKLFHKNAYGDFLDDQPLSPVTIDWEPVKAHRGVSVTFIKHSTLLIRDEGCVLLIDPVFDNIFWFIKDFTPLAFELDDMPRPDHVLITHGHYDHLDKPSLAALDPGTHVISPLGYDSEFKAVGMTHRTRLDWYEHGCLCAAMVHGVQPHEPGGDGPGISGDQGQATDDRPLGNLPTGRRTGSFSPRRFDKSPW
ncbi:MAG: MBL fold metallo-hydrolase [Desulfosarcina sp.]|nr:MBL fold metallo-hydrolase [Desulfosarcina sp.]MBC2765638.1 MBL fold metallo-hydrolase [Desulfosarcina sp.]